VAEAKDLCCARQCRRFCTGCYTHWSGDRNVVTSELAGNRKLDFVDNTCCVNQVGRKYQVGCWVLRKVKLARVLSVTSWKLAYAYLSINRVTVYFYGGPVNVCCLCCLLVVQPVAMLMSICQALSLSSQLAGTLVTRNCSKTRWTQWCQTWGFAPRYSFFNDFLSFCVFHMKIWGF